jgi:hypothetical protein
MIQEMEYQFKSWGRTRVPKLRGYYFVQSLMSIKMEVIDTPLKVHGEYQSHQPQVMVAMKMAYEDMVNPVNVGLHTHKLNLRCFAAVYQEGFVLNFNVL